jgi:hypothetical protein
MDEFDFTKENSYYIEKTNSPNGPDKSETKTDKKKGMMLSILEKLSTPHYCTN